MNTRLDVANDAFSLLDENISSREIVIRLALSGTMLILLLMRLEYIDPMLLVAASVYLYTTALIQWDPLYALMKGGMSHPDVTHPATKNEGAITTKVASIDAKRAANDPQKTDLGLKKAG